MKNSKQKSINVLNVPRDHGKIETVTRYKKIIRQRIKKSVLPSSSARKSQVLPPNLVWTYAQQNTTLSQMPKILIMWKDFYALLITFQRTAHFYLTENRIRLFSKIWEFVALKHWTKILNVTFYARHFFWQAKIVAMAIFGASGSKGLAHKAWKVETWPWHTVTSHNHVVFSETHGLIRRDWWQIRYLRPCCKMQISKTGTANLT